jgi:hypothetical protein
MDVMATGSRTLKLSILGDVSDLNKSLKTANNDVEGFGSKVSDFGKKAGLAFAAVAAAAGAYAIKIGIDGVKAAIEDEAAQASLAKTLQNVTGATDATIKSTEDYILKTQLAFGVTDEDLRPSLERLIRATKDSSEAQKLQGLALDISAGSGKSLEAVTNALSKSFEGSSGSLAKLGVGLSAAELKTMDFDAITKTLSNTFGGQAATNADTYQGRINRLKVAFDETKESIGTALLPILQTLLTFITNNILPIFTKVSDALNGASGLNTYFMDVYNTLKSFFLPIFEGLRKAFGYIGDAIADNKESFLKFGQFIEQYVAPVLGTVLGGALEVIGKIAGGVITIIAKVIDGFTVLINGAISGINLLIRAYNAIPFLPNVNEIGGLNMSTPKISAQSILGSGSAGSSVGGISSSESTGSMGGAGSVAASVAAAISTALPSGIKYPSAPNLTPSEALFSSLTGTSGNFPGSKVSPFLAQSPTINLTVNGAIDPIGTARSIYTALGLEATTSGTFSNLGGSRVVAQ